jgi:two-component system response regulator FixJ
MGYQVAIYESGLDFLKEAPNIKAGCIVTDVRMPGPNGIELTAQLRSRHIDLPVIVMSGHDDGSFAALASRAGAAEFIAKPFDDDLLLEAIQRLESCSTGQHM